MSGMCEFERQLAADAARVERFLSTLCPTDAQTEKYAVLPEAQRYSLMAGGKRIRPVLTLAFCRLFGGHDEHALPYACALEMIHTYSLIHDDLPCMDDDDLRRGRPTNHRVYGEAIALQAGDAMLTDAFYLAATAPHLPGETNARAVAMLSRAAGTYGMVGGQVLDLLGETAQAPDFETLQLMHRRKTGALIRVAATLGALAAGVGEDDVRMQHAAHYAETVGMVFQIIDDILDVTGTAGQLGKQPGSDVAQEKTTFLSFLTIPEARRYAERLNESACDALRDYEGNAYLIRLAEYLLDRNH